MDYDSSTKFISSLAKFLQSLCNGYVEFDNGVQVIGHLYLSVDTGKTIDYILNEKVCKTDKNSVTFISNSFHAQPAERPKAPAKKPFEKDSKVEDASENQTVTPEPRSTNFGTLPSRSTQNSSHSQNFKRAFSPSSKRTKDGASPSKSGRTSPKHKKNRTESLDQNLSLQASNSTNENSTSSQPSPTADGITAPVSALSTEALHSSSQYTDSYQQNFFQTGDDENSMADESEERDIKPSIDTDVTFIKEEFAPSSCSQSSNQNRDRNQGDDSSAYYSNQSFPTTNFASPAGFGGTVRSNFSSAADRSSLYSSGPGSSHLEADNSGDPSDTQPQIQKFIPFFETELLQLEQLSANMRQLTNKIDKLESHIESESFSKVPVNDASLPSLPENFVFPLDDIEQLKSLNTCLTDLNIKKKMVLYLLNYGGKNAKDALYRILKELLAPSLSVKYSMEGKKGKLKFNDLRNIKFTIFESVLSRYPCTIKDLEKNTGSWLALSADRGGGRKRRGELSTMATQINNTI